MIETTRRYLPYLLIGTAIVVVELAIQASALTGGTVGRTRLWLMQYMGFWPGLLGDWQSNFTIQPLTMFASYWLLHATPAHLLGNLLVLGWLAQRIGPELRFRETWEIWTVSILGGAVGFGLLNTSPSPMIGASGGTFGLLGAYVVLNYNQVRRMHGSGKAAWRSGLICAGILGLSVADYMLRSAILAWQAHLGGFFAGALLTTALKANSSISRS